ncbi:hypothetical protein [Neobacillus ginsengisoli]|uniref:Uncharacterized protein YcfL n=1 Tax=Neobacillus ginsengisoli TaxID=904295 RepID=A0ABT9XUH0_9BACI|nr:hypothetical protein [Neobacillus ginsengisoli]MDQ0199210.1 uncharacterized protein YcfL [Neobacillus ginsengisoli]
MKDLKKWLLTLMASFMLIGVASGCSSNEKKTEANTQLNEDNGSTPSFDQGTEQSGQ